VSGLSRVVLDWPRQNTVQSGGELYFCLEREGTLYVIRSRCPHRGGPLHLGRIGCGAEANSTVGPLLRCPWHGTKLGLDWLCDRAAPSVRCGSQVTTYIPVPSDSGVAPSAARQIVLASAGPRHE
jgi:phenylpropionate dioxygenase-like ring-hydroxylating dioxygenase large terminal subunit